MTVTHADIPSDGKTDLQRDILLTWYDNPNATNKEIAQACDCSPSYVSQIKNRFDDYDHMEAMMDRQDREMERMFGDDLFAWPASGATGQRGGGPSLDLEGGGSPDPAEGPGLAEMYEELPNNAVGHIMRAIILLVTLYIAYEIVTILFL